MAFIIVMLTTIYVVGWVVHFFLSMIGQGGKPFPMYNLMMATIWPLPYIAALFRIKL